MASSKAPTQVIVMFTCAAQLYILNMLFDVHIIRKYEDNRYEEMSLLWTYVENNYNWL